MRARSNSEHDDAALQLGTMLEHLAKAYLASLHPTLVMDSKGFDFSSLLRLAGHGQRVKPGHVLKTVQLMEALIRIGSMQAAGNEGAGRTFASRFDLVAQARNGVAHAGDDGGRADEVAQLAVQGAHEILSLMGRTLGDLFGDYTVPAEALRDEHATKVQQQVTLLVARARQAFAERYVTTAEAPRVSQLDAMDRQTAVELADDPSRIPVICPVCNRTGILSGSADLDWPQVELEQDGEPLPFVSIGPPRAVLFADAYRCPVCGLRLMGLEQLVEAGLEPEVELPSEEVARLEYQYYGLEDADTDL
jgi:hypothetical protein